MTKSAFRNHHHHHHSLPPLPQPPASAPKRLGHRRRWSQPPQEGASTCTAEPLNLSCSGANASAENPDSSDTIRKRNNLPPETPGTRTGSTVSPWSVDFRNGPQDSKNITASPTASVPFLHHHPGVPLVAAFGLPVMKSSSTAKGFRHRSTTDENRERGDDVIRRQRANFAEQVIGFPLHLQLI